VTLLSTIQDAAREIGLPSPTTVIGNTDPNVTRTLAMAQREGKELVRKSWTILQREHTFTTTATVDEYTLPADYATLLSNTAWDRENYWAMRGPLSAQEWQARKSAILGATVGNAHWRIKRAASGNTKKFVVDPIPTATGDELVFDYRSDSWCASSGGTIQTAWAADTDTGILSESLMTMGIVWRFLRLIGNDYASQLSEYEEARDTMLADDLAMSAKVLHDTRRVSLFTPNIPDTGYG
jgi:hypothetical protein